MLISTALITAYSLFPRIQASRQYGQRRQITVDDVLFIGDILRLTHYNVGRYLSGLALR